MKPKYILPITIGIFIIFLLIMFFMLNAVYESGKQQGDVEATYLIAQYQTQTLNILFLQNETIGQVELNKLCLNLNQVKGG